MRALKTKDLGLFSKIVSKMEVKEEIKGLMVSIDGTNMTEEELAIAQEQSEEELGVSLMIIVVENYWKAEKDVHNLLANLTDMSIKKVADLPLKDLIVLLKELIDDESFQDFFSLVAG